MERKSLKELGLSEEQINKAMTLFNQELEDFKGTKEELESVKNENESLKSQVADRDEEISSLGEQAGNTEEMKSQIEQLQQTIKDNDNQAASELSKVKQDNALTNYLKDSGVRDVKAVMPFIDQDTIKYDDEKGELIGVKEQVENLKSDHDFLFEPANEETKPGIHATAGGNPGGNPPAEDDAFAKALGLQNTQSEEAK